MGIIDARGVSPICAGPLPTAIHSLLMRHVDNQELTVEAAVTGNRQLAMQALFNDPLIRDVDAAHAIFNDLLAAHKPHLPQFHA